MDYLSSSQLSEWEAYDRIDPIGTWVDEFRIARLEALILNIALKWASGKKQTETVDALDFMPDWLGDKEKEPKKQSVAQMKEFLLGFAKQQNKKVAIQAKREQKRKEDGQRRGNDDRNPRGSNEGSGGVSKRHDEIPKADK